MPDNKALQKWDPKTQKIMKAIRIALHPSPRPTMSSMQTTDAADVANGPLWVSRAVFPEPSVDDLLVKFSKACLDLQIGSEIQFPVAQSIRGEWIGHRQNASAAAAEPNISEHAKYDSLMKDTSSQVTILYIHGGGFFRGSPASNRRTTSELARRTGGRCFVVGYRLSPQNVFPAALLDVFLAYLYLLYPPRDSFHSAIPSPKIVVAGDSAGGGLVLALLQLMLKLKSGLDDRARAFSFNDSAVSLPFPAGYAGLSVYGDVTLLGLPSWFENADVDYFDDLPPYLYPNFPQCKLWPTTPARAATYCSDSLLCHPLVSPTLSENWAGSPPIWLSCGEERLADSAKVIAHRAASQGVSVVWEQYEALPHCFCALSILDYLPQTDRCFKGWADFCSQCVNKPSHMKTKGTWIQFSNAEEVPVEVEKLSPLPFGEVRRRMESARGSMLTIFNEARKKAKL